jgi:aryl-alcohol dehydrogenase-like predicted oxidoreductase
VQNSYSLLDRAPERDLFALCADQGVGFTAFSPLAGGWLTGKYQSGCRYPEGSRMTLRPEPYRHLVNDAVFRALTAFSAAARSRDVEMSALALAWVLHHPQMNAAIVGPRRPVQLDAALSALEINLSPQQRADLTGIFAPARD